MVGKAGDPRRIRDTGHWTWSKLVFRKCQMNDLHRWSTSDQMRSPRLFKCAGKPRQPLLPLVLLYDRPLNTVQVSPRHSMNEWRRPERRGPGADRERAYLAAAKRKDRSLDQRLRSAVDASKIHYERTGCCFNITREIVQKGASFDELDDKEEFFNPDLILPDGVSVAELWSDHVRAISGVEYEEDLGSERFGQPVLNPLPTSRMSPFLSAYQYPFASGYPPNIAPNGMPALSSRTSNGTFDTLLLSQPSQNCLSVTSQPNWLGGTDDKGDGDEINFDEWLK